MPIVPIKKPTPPKPARPDTDDGATFTGAAKERIDKLMARIKIAEKAATDAEAAMTRVTELESQIANQAREADMLRFVYAGNLSEDAMDPEVIEDVGRRFDRRVTTLGADKAGTFADFLAETAKAPPVTLRAAFTPRATVETPAGASNGAAAPEKSAPVKPGNANAGVIPRGGPAPASSFSEDAVGRMDAQSVRANLASIRAQLEAEGLVKPGAAAKA